MGHSYDGAERRKYPRINKSLSLFFYLKDSPSKKLDETFTKDISKGGLRFTTAYSLKPGALLVFEIGIPFIAPKRLILEGLVVACREISRGYVYEIRAKFISMSDQALQLFGMIEKQNLKG